MFKCKHFLPAILEMTSSFDMFQKHRASIEFFVLEKEPPKNVFKSLEKA